jgi:hypothetical protein
MNLEKKSKLNLKLNDNILVLITKEKELKTKLNLYETINKEYTNLSKNIDNKEKKIQFDILVQNLLTLKEQIISLAREIKELRHQMIMFNDKINYHNDITDKKILNIINLMEDQNKELIKNKSTINDFSGSNNEFSKIFITENIKYIYFFLILALLIFNIITSIFVPYKTNLEIMILIILTIVGLYYLHQIIIKKYKNDYLKLYFNYLKLYFNY